jgi:hypothetical protein
MKRIAKIAQFTSGLVLLASVGSAPADNHKVLILEVAADCRTFVNGPNRADVSFGSGKLFPTGTLPSGTASNDPTEPVNGIAAIGDWTTRGQNAFPFTPEVASSYNSTPTFFATQYFFLNGGRTALTGECYAFFPSGEGFCSLTVSANSGASPVMSTALRSAQTLLDARTSALRSASSLALCVAIRVINEISRGTGRYPCPLAALGRTHFRHRSYICARRLCGATLAHA